MKTDIQDIVYNNLSNYVNKTKKNDVSLILALSGGIDSIVLSDILLKINKIIPFKLFFFHMNYNIHSKSKLMQDYCIDFAFKNNVKIFNKSIDSNKIFKVNFESNARKYRYQELKDICLRNNIDCILTAHHENDQIETIYMCKKNNSSWISKIGIREKFYLLQSNKNKITVLRPMLSISKESIIKYAKMNKLKFYDDPTNLNPKFLRNKTRLELNSKINDLEFRNSILEISKLNKEKILKISSNIKQKESKIIFFSKRKSFVILNKSRLLDQDFDFFRLMIKRILNREFLYNYEASTIFWKNLFKFILTKKIGKSFTLEKNTNINLCSSRKYVYIYFNNNEESDVMLDCLGNYETNLGIISILPSNHFIEYKNKNGFCVPRNYIKDLKIENWEYGNKCISSNNLTLKVSDIFINNKLSLFEKENYPIIKYKNDIIWIPNLFHGKIDMSSSRNFLNLRWNCLL